jgi:glucose-1-phosphate thymidylyltransferase
MKGIILAGGMGTRMSPCTKVTNKHLLPVYKKPMIYYPVEALVKAGVKNILIITGPENAGDFMKLLGSGKDFGCEFTYRIQDEAGGIAQALSLAENFVHGDKMVVILGDNIFEDDMGEFVRSFEKEEGAHIFLKEVSDPERFGVAEVDGNRIVSIEEKPKNPKTNYATIGLYMYDSSVFEIIRTLKPSGRGELEITDVNNAYIEKGKMGFSILKGFWTDAGTFESLYRAFKLLKEKEG